MACINPLTGEWTYDEQICAAIDPVQLYQVEIGQVAASAGIPVSAVDPVTLTPQWEEIYTPEQLAYLGEIQRLKQAARDPTKIAVTSIVSGLAFLVGGAAAPLTTTLGLVSRAAVSATARTPDVETATIQPQVAALESPMNGDTGTGFDILPYLQGFGSILSAASPLISAAITRPAQTPAFFNAGPYQPILSSILPGVTPTAGPGGVAIRGMLSPALSAARAVVKAIGAKIFAAVGRRVSPQQALALAKRVGIDTAALALGLSTVELAQYVLHSQAVRGRRRRGITGRQISNARSTIRRMTGFMAQVQQACAPAMRRGARRHRAGCACVVCRRAA